MIQARRRLHRGLSVAMALILVPLLLFGLTRRPPVPPVAELPPPLPESAGFAAAGNAEPVRLGSAPYPFEVRLEAPTDTPGVATLAIRPQAVILKPDLLVYWSPTATPADNLTPDLTPDAILLGSLSGTRWRRLPLPPGSGEGHILIYSLAHQTIVTQFSLQHAIPSPGAPE